MEDKQQKLEDLMSDIRTFAENAHYTEEVYKKQNKVIFRRITFPNGATETASMAFAGKLRRYFGCTKTVDKY
jgi:hypothetical protein